MLAVKKRANVEAAPAMFLAAPRNRTKTEYFTKILSKDA
jgi:hypothetical protein